MKHPCLQMTAPRTGIAGEGKPYRISPEDQAGKLDLKASLKGRRRARYPGQRAALRSNVDWPLRYAHCGKRTGCVPPGPDVPGVLSTSSVRVRTRTGRIKPAEPPRVAPFFIRLSVSPIRLTRPSGAATQTNIKTPALTRWAIFLRRFAALGNTSVSAGNCVAAFGNRLVSPWRIVFRVLEFLESPGSLQIP